MKANSRRDNPDSLIRKSRYLHVIEITDDRFVALHALTRFQAVINREIVDLLAAFNRPVRMEVGVRDFLRVHPGAESTALEAVKRLLSWGLLFKGSKVAESKMFAHRLSEVLGRDPARGLSRFWNEHRTGQSSDLFSVVTTRCMSSLATKKHNVSAIFVGACHVQFGMDLMREEAERIGIEFEAVATFPQDTAILQERKHDLVLVGPLQRPMELMMDAPSGQGDAAPHHIYVRAVSDLVSAIRKVSQAPILVDGLPVPTVTPHGEIDRDTSSHRNRVRQVNLGLVEMSAVWSDVVVVDVDSALSLSGKIRLLDDSVVSFAHLGNLFWRKILPYSPGLKRLMPRFEGLLEAYGGDDIYAFDRVLARARLNIVVTLMGIERRKCVIVDLDNTLWPGLLAEHDAPFVYDGHFNIPLEYYGVHEALKVLKERGILLACVSKNDEEVVRKLWRYPDEEPELDPILPRRAFSKMLTLDDFVTYRINWMEKVHNIQEIANELNIGLDSIVFVDDEPVEREKVRKYLPSVMVLGDNFYTVRRRLLTDPTLQVPKITEEAKERVDMMKGQLARERYRQSIVDQDEFLRSLEIRVGIEKARDAKSVDRIHELVLRTNQFNTTTRRYRKDELKDISEGKCSQAQLYVLRARDRFTNYGLVAVCVLRQNIIESFVMSCRTIGLGIEDVLLRHVMRDLKGRETKVLGEFIPTDRNAPARNLFKNNGYSLTGEHRWECDLSKIADDLLSVPDYYEVVHS